MYHINKINKQKKKLLSTKMSKVMSKFSIKRFKGWLKKKFTALSCAKYKQKNQNENYVPQE